MTEDAPRKGARVDREQAVTLLTYQINILRQEYEALRKDHEDLRREHYNLKTTFNKWINWGFGVASAVGFIAITTGYVAGWLKTIGFLR